MRGGCNHHSPKRRAGARPARLYFRDRFFLYSRVSGLRQLACSRSKASVRLRTALRASVFKQSFRSAWAERVTFSCSCKRKQPKRNTPLALRFSGSCPKSARQLACVPLRASRPLPPQCKREPKSSAHPARKNNCAANDVRRDESTRCNASTLSDPLLRGA